MINKKTQIKLPCPRCGSANTIKAGKNYQNKRQKMLCKDCGFMFQDGKIGEEKRANPAKNNAPISNQARKEDDSNE